MFNFIKKIRKKNNTSKKGYNLSYDNLAIPEIHIKGSDEESPEVSDIDDNNNNHGQNAQEVDNVESPGHAVQSNSFDDTHTVNRNEHKKTHVTYDGVAVPEIHFKDKE